jgi:hypothetical protein
MRRSAIKAMEACHRPMGLQTLTNKISRLHCWLVFQQYNVNTKRKKKQKRKGSSNNKF